MQSHFMVKPNLVLRLGWGFDNVNCNSSNIVYLVGCGRCRKQYIEETDRKLKKRFRERRVYVTAKMENQATGKHYNKVIVSMTEGENVDHQVQHKIQ